MRVPTWIIPLLIVVLTVLALAGARLFAIPSLTIDLVAAGEPLPDGAGRVVLLVDGVKCVDTAQQAAVNLGELPGVLRYVAYASRNRVEITYDPSVTGLPAIREAIEGPVFEEESGEFLFDLFNVIEIDGRPVSD